MFQGSMFRLNMFVIAFFASDGGMVKTFNFMLFPDARICHLVLRQRSPKCSAFYPSSIIAAVFLHWPRNSPSFDSFGHPSAIFSRIMIKTERHFVLLKLPRVKCRPRFTKSSSLVLIRLVLTEI